MEFSKGPVKLAPPVNIPHSFLQPVSNLFNFIIFRLPMKIYNWLSKNFSKPAPDNGEISHFNFESHFRPTLKISYPVLLNSYPKLYGMYFFVLIVFITAGNMSCIHIKQ